MIMPESKGRPQKGTFVPPPRRAADADKTSPSWYAPLFVVLLVVGLLWIVVYYVSSGALPIGALGAWNLAVGFAVMMIGFMMTMNWR